MVHKPLHIKDVSLSFSHKTCFINFTTQIMGGSRIAIIGKNGSGKSTLLKMIAEIYEVARGSITWPKDLTIGYVSQVIEEPTYLNGAERFKKALQRTLSYDPHILLLDEPTNNLDAANRAYLQEVLDAYSGTLIMVSHDTQLLRSYADTLWHIDQGKITIFSGNYDDYITHVVQARDSVLHELKILNRQKKNIHHQRMAEEQRAAKSKLSGEKKIKNRRWLQMVGDLKGMKAEKSQGKKLRIIDETKHDLLARLAALKLPEVIVPKFSLTSAQTKQGTVVQVSGGTVGYSAVRPLLREIHLIVSAGERVALTGDNGIGKSTLLKAIAHDETIYTFGHWYRAHKDDIGYFDQHYALLDHNKTVYQTIAECMPHASSAQIRSHLNNFLFRKNDEVTAFVYTLSGGEKARLSLAQIAAKTPQLLLLDEVTNNLDLETKEHISQVLVDYPGTLVVISHDDDFLDKIGITIRYDVSRWRYL